jgi:prepilin-type N-terminal cleavage/methylation domain-containing protein
MRNLRNNKGFTLIELMIVVVIIGILAAIAIPKFQAVSQNAKKSEAGPVLKQICSLQGTFFQETGAYAGSVGALTGFDVSTNTAAKYFVFSTTGNNAVATPNAGLGTAADLPTITRNCDTGTDVES